MPAIIWVHEDAISRDHPVFQHAGIDADPLFIWDADDLKSRGHSFKKLVFIYECLEEINVEIRQGKTTEVLMSYGEEGYKIFFAETQNPDLMKLIAPVQREYDVRMVSRPRLGDVEVKPEMKRFFRYWNKARASILKKPHH